MNLSQVSTCVHSKVTSYSCNLWRSLLHQFFEKYHISVTSENLTVTYIGDVDTFTNPGLIPKWVPGWSGTIPIVLPASSGTPLWNPSVSSARLLAVSCSWHSFKKIIFFIFFCKLKAADESVVLVDQKIFFVSKYALCVLHHLLYLPIRLNPF